VQFYFFRKNKYLNYLISENIRTFATQMCSPCTLKVDLNGLKEGVTPFEYNLDDAYFSAINGDEVKHGNINVALVIRRTSDVFELDFHTEGTVIVPCDRCLDDMEQAVMADNRLVAKFGEEYSEDDDLVTVDKNEGIIDVTWFIYEFIALSVPVKHVHAPGKCNPAMIRMLEEHSSTRSSDEETSKPVDPRWSELEKLKNKIKD
jgi:uncharacterized metal-binding protein YceD (DUF177 family)